MMPTKRALFESDDSASIVNDARSTCSRLPTVIAGNRNRFFCTNAKLPANMHLQEQQEQRRHERHEREKDEQHRQLAGDVLGPHQRLRQIDLQRVGAPIVGDQPRADIDRDDEDEEVLLLEKLAEGFSRRSEERGLLIVRADVQLHDADDEGHPREDQDPHEARFRISVLMPAHAMTVHERPTGALAPP